MVTPALQLPITPIGISGASLHSPFPQVAHQQAIQTGSANQRLIGAAHKLLHEQLLVKKSNALHPDQTINRPKFGVCIKKTDYRATQEDRVSFNFQLSIVFSSSSEKTSMAALRMQSSLSSMDTVDIKPLIFAQPTLSMSSNDNPSSTSTPSKPSKKVSIAFHQNSQHPCARPTGLPRGQSSHFPLFRNFPFSIYRSVTVFILQLLLPLTTSFAIRPESSITCVAPRACSD